MTSYKLLCSLLVVYSAGVLSACEATTEIGKNAASTAGAAGRSVSSNAGAGGEQGDTVAGSAGIAADGGSRSCAQEHDALLEALRSAVGTCTTSSDCSYFTAWAAPTEAQFCNGGWPIYNLTEKQSDLDAKNQALADCQAETNTVPSVGTCTRALPPPTCVQGICTIPALE
jgi:hypothetical protein